jgi:hypothetical protein
MEQAMAVPADKHNATPPAPEAPIRFHRATERDAAELRELMDISRAVAAAWREHAPPGPDMVDPRHPLVGLTLAIRRNRRGEAPAIRIIAGTEFQRYIAAVRVVAELAPVLLAQISAETATATPSAARIPIEGEVLSAVTAHLAEAAAFAERAAKVCEAATRPGNLQAHWHTAARLMGRSVTTALRRHAEAHGRPPPALSLRNPESAAAKLATALLAIAGIAKGTDAFAQLHRRRST